MELIPKESYVKGKKRKMSLNLGVWNMTPNVGLVSRSVDEGVETYSCKYTYGSDLPFLKNKLENLADDTMVGLHLRVKYVKVPSANLLYSDTLYLMVGDLTKQNLKFKEKIQFLYITIDSQTPSAPVAPNICWAMEDKFSLENLVYVESDLPIMMLTEMLQNCPKLKYVYYNPYPNIFVDCPEIWNLRLFPKNVERLYAFVPFRKLAFLCDKKITQMLKVVKTVHLKYEQEQHLFDHNFVACLEILKNSALKLEGLRVSFVWARIQKLKEILIYVLAANRETLKYIIPDDKDFFLRFFEDFRRDFEDVEILSNTPETIERKETDGKDHIFAKIRYC